MCSRVYRPKCGWLAYENSLKGNPAAFSLPYQLAPRAVVDFVSADIARRCAEFVSEPQPCEVYGRFVRISGG